ncbi:DUF6368 family protein [Kitasatospora sp. NPDC050543]|uniref:DUF6368 family protein n=1 Tax=Kitasatospora sp. NPDC050543 TaxID=3364054 RepID=UPI003796151C
MQFSAGLPVRLPAGADAGWDGGQALAAPGIGDEETFEAEHADGPDLESLIGFSPTHAVDVIAGCNRPIDHLATALLTAAVMDVVGGVANADTG